MSQVVPCVCVCVPQASVDIFRASVGPSLALTVVMWEKPLFKLILLEDQQLGYPAIYGQNVCDGGTEHCT